jgi:hypothetical protein
MSITDIAPVVAGERVFPTCIHWCGWHWAEDTPEDPGCCWAQDVSVPGVVEVMATWDEHRTSSNYEWPRKSNGKIDTKAEPVVTEEPAPPLSITVFRADVLLDEGINFTSIEAAEAAAHALLAMTARLRGDEQLAQVHLTAATPTPAD